MAGSPSPGRRSGAAPGSAPTADNPSWRTVADDGWQAASALGAPRDGGQTGVGLPRRVPMAQLVPGGVEKPTTASNKRTPDAVRGLLSAYHRGVQRGRTTPTADNPESTTNGPQGSQSGKEQEA
jgi:hypothetical protein